MSQQTEQEAYLADLGLDLIDFDTTPFDASAVNLFYQMVTSARGNIITYDDEVVTHDGDVVIHY